ncbi:hypothetical protein Hanom_Chr07g00619331 [Helianthus anomalus]
MSYFGFTAVVPMIVGRLYCFDHLGSYLRVSLSFSSGSPELKRWVLVATRVSHGLEASGLVWFSLGSHTTCS